MSKQVLHGGLGFIQPQVQIQAIQASLVVDVLKADIDYTKADATRATWKTLPRQYLATHAKLRMGPGEGLHTYMRATSKKLRPKQRSTYMPTIWKDAVIAYVDTMAVATAQVPQTREQLLSTRIEECCEGACPSVARLANGGVTKVWQIWSVQHKRAACVADLRAARHTVWQSDVDTAIIAMTVDTRVTISCAPKQSTQGEWMCYKDLGLAQKALQIVDTIPGNVSRPTTRARVTKWNKQDGKWCCEEGTHQVHLEDIERAVVLTKAGDDQLRLLVVLGPQSKAWADSPSRMQIHHSTLQTATTSALRKAIERHRGKDAHAHIPDTAMTVAREMGYQANNKWRTVWSDAWAA